MCDLHKVFKLIHYQFATLAEFFLSVFIFLVPELVSFTVNAILKNYTIFLFKILCWRYWKTAAVHQRLIMLAEWDEDNKLAPLEPCHGSTSTSFAYSTLGSLLVERLQECWTRAREDKNDLPVQRRRVHELPLPDSKGRKAGLQVVRCVSCYLALELQGWS